MSKSLHSTSAEKYTDKFYNIQAGFLIVSYQHRKFILQILRKKKAQNQARLTDFIITGMVPVSIDVVSNFSHQFYDIS